MKYWRMQEHVECIGEERGDEQRQPRADPSELDEQRVRRDDRHRVRQEDRRDQQREQQVPARESEAREPVRHEGAGEHRPDRPDDRQRERVEQQARIVDQVPDFGEVLQVRGERPRRLERPPRSLPHDRRRRRIARIDELALGPPRLQQRQLAGRAVERHVVDVERLAFVFEGRRIGRVDRRSRLADLVRGLEGERRRAQQRRQERGEEQDGDEREQE